MIAKVYLTTTKPGQFQLIVDDMDMSNIVDCVTIEAVAGELPSVSLHMRARVSVNVNGLTYIMSPVQVNHGVDQ